ncbi:MAG: hypothetical protein HQL11_06890 [Candidatus Omnitrophica bacterium]|nr:hypothetical protein [Candidatus Omnitrophota bacterium]
MGNALEVFFALAQSPLIQVRAWLYEEARERAHSEAQRLGQPAVYGRVQTDTQISSALDEAGRPELGIVANFGLRLSVDTLSVCRFGFLNAHPGLIPQNRGREPVAKSLKNGDIVTGLTVHRMTDRIDSGPIVGCCEHVIRARDHDTVTRELYRLAPPIILDHIEYLVRS